MVRPRPPRPQLFRISRSHQIWKQPLRPYSVQPVPSTRVFVEHAGREFRRTVRTIWAPVFLAFSMAVVGTAFAFEGTHQYVEHIGMSSIPFSEWEWQNEIEDWSGGAKGGTSAALGWRIRHLVRGAWMALHWSSQIVTVERASPFHPPESVERGDQGYLIAEAQLSDAIKLLTQRQQEVPVALIIRHSEILERIGTPIAVAGAFEAWSRLYQLSDPTSLHALRCALKIGNLSARLGKPQEAVEWWSRTVKQLTSKSGKPSPAEQRLLSSAYLALSAQYSSSGDLQTAWQTQRVALATLNTFLPTPPLSTTSPEERLHIFFLTHSASLFSLHNAEVQYALSEDIGASISRLNAAASSAQLVVTALCTPSTKSDDMSSLLPQIELSSIPLKASSYALSREYTSCALSEPAKALLRDARRAAVQAWSLTGTLQEKKGNRVEAKACYERALAWAGGSIKDAAKVGIPESEWRSTEAKLVHLSTSN
jgi:tetratricopeptide (TPR) repeat protein